MITLIEERKKERKKERNLALDIARIIAVLMVVMIHISARFVISYDVSSSEFVFGNIFDSVSRVGVPLFVMISGALMLDENRQVNVKRNIKNIVCLLVFWSVLYCVFNNIALPLVTGGTLSLYNIVNSLINGSDHMWYMYMIMVLYLATPFLRMFVKKENKNQILLFITVSVVTQFTLPMLKGLSQICQGLNIAVKLFEQFNLGFFGSFVAYYLVGWYVVHVGIKKKWIFYCLGILSLLVMMLYVQKTKDYSNGYSNMNILVLLYAVAVFVLINSLRYANVGEKIKSIIVVLSNLTFGVYIVHPLLQTVIGWIIKYTHNPFMYLVISFFVVIVLSFAVCFIASKIPIIKRAFRM